MFPFNTVTDWMHLEKNKFDDNGKTELTNWQEIQVSLNLYKTNFK
jgi:hypothetical protein